MLSWDEGDTVCHSFKMTNIGGYSASYKHQILGIEKNILSVEQKMRNFEECRC